jgi:hypothetical protein
MYFPGINEKPEFVEVESASMRNIKLKAEGESAGEVNARVRKLIEENMGVDLLKIDVEVGTHADLFDLNQGFTEFADNFRILEVNVKPKMVEEGIELEQLRLNSDLIKEYFEKAGIQDKELVEKCVELYERYSDE